MKEKQIPYIKSITISKLWDEVDIYWQLDPNVNILVGKNGTGKTTLLKIIEETIIKNLKGEFFNNLQFKKIEIEFSPRIIFPTYDLFYIIKKSDHSKRKIESNSPDYRYVSNIVKLFKINTFEMSIDEFKDRLILFKQEYLKTQLDLILIELINDFKSYQLTLRKLIESKVMELDNEIKTLSSQESVTNEELIKLRDLLKQKDDITAEINHTKNIFLDLINELFGETNKQIDFDENNSIIFHKPNDQIISVYELSSGEKQLLIILLTVVIQQNKPSVLLMDEPELSLHLSWQIKLIDMIQSLNNNCQLIIVTHAPGICRDGWRDKVVNIEDIIKVNEYARV